MENSLKQRIIGAVVLVALAIIFLPSILKEKASNGIFETKIPEKPAELERYQIDTESVERLIADDSNQPPPTEASDESSKTLSDSSNKQQLPDKKTKRQSKVVVSKDVVANNESLVESPKKPIGNNNKAETIDKNFQTAAWVVQVASFSNESNAIKLVQKLKASKYKAYRRKVKSSNKWVFRVFVGPYIEKKQASKSLISINKVSETTSIIRPFDPVKH